MNQELLQRLLFGPDPRSNTGVFARGANVYNGIGSAPNPLGMNQASAAQRALELRTKIYGGLNVNSY